MDAVAYPNQEVISFLNSQVVPLRIPADHPQLAPQFTVKWTPCLLVLDEKGKEHERALGFLGPQELIAYILLGMGKAKFNRPDRPAADKLFEQLISTYPKSSFTPEAIYMQGVARYIESHEVKHLIALYDRITTDYPQSPWAMRAQPYKLLKK